MDRKSDTRAVAVKKVMAAAVFPFTIDDEGRVSVGDTLSWTERDWGDEEGVVSQLFDYLRAHQDKPVLTYGGLAMDIPVLLLSGMAHGLAASSSADRSPRAQGAPAAFGPRPADQGWRANLEPPQPGIIAHGRAIRAGCRQARRQASREQGRMVGAARCMSSWIACCYR